MLDRIQAREPARRLGGAQVGRDLADPCRGALDAPLGRGHRDGVLVGAEDLAGDRRPGVAVGLLGGRRGHPRAARRVEREVAQRLRQRGGVAARDQHAVDAVAHDVAVAGDVAGDHGGAGGERLGEDHAEALPAQRRCAQHVRLGQDSGLLGVAHLPQHPHAAVVHQQRGDLVASGADDEKLDGHVLAHRLEGA